jgi:ammonia channel protein AmtB
MFISIGFVYPFLAHWMWGANGWLGAVVGARVRDN